MRVIAGAFRGRRLAAPRGRSTRPTSDRVREALCMVLEPWQDLRVVDLFAGSGALGIEALSRGAARVDFAESSRAALEALRSNLDTLGLEEQATIWKAPLPSGLRAMRECLASADVVLVDPPYGGTEARRTLEVLSQPGVLRVGCRVVVEHHAKDTLSDRWGRLRRVSRRAYGETHITFYELRDDEAPEAGGREA